MKLLHFYYELSVLILLQSLKIGELFHDVSRGCYFSETSKSFKNFTYR